MDIQAQLDALGIHIPEAPAPVASYVPGLVSGGQLVTSGQLPLADGKLVTGKLGADISLEEASQAAQTAAINCLAVAKQVLGSFDRIARVFKIVVYVNSTEDFSLQSKVANGASDFIGQVFGTAGVHIRSAVGVSSLPLGACCEIEMSFELQD